MTCYTRACALVSDHASLIEMPANGDITSFVVARTEFIFGACTLNWRNWHRQSFTYAVDFARI